MAGQLEIRTFGGFAICDPAGQGVNRLGRKAQALIAILSTEAGRRISREKLVGLLWSDRGEEQARSSLRQALIAIKRVPQLATIMEASRDELSISSSQCSIDVSELMSAAASSDPQRWASGASLYRGEFLDGLCVRDASFDEWLTARRENYRKAAASLLERLARSGPVEERLQAASRLVTLAPHSEMSFQVLIQALLNAGRLSEARQEFERCRAMLRTEYGAVPSAETLGLFGDEGTARGAEATHLPEMAVGKASVRQANRWDRGLTTPRSGRVYREGSAILVLPFKDMSGGPKQDYFADGLTEDIITELSRFRNLVVMARNTSLHFKGKNPNFKQLEHDLGVTYVLEGSARISGDRLRITCHLTETLTGANIWAERYDRDLQDILTLQEDLSASVASTVCGRLDAAGRARAMRLTPEEMRSYDLHLRSKAYYLRYTPSDMKEAIRLSQMAVDLDPNSSLSLAFLAHFHFLTYLFGWADDAEASVRNALAFAKHAVAINDTDSTARWVLGLIHLHMRGFEEAETQFRKGIELNPNDYEARGMYGLHLACVGDPERAVEEMEHLRQRNPFDMSWTPWLLGIAYFTARRYGKALENFSLIADPHSEILLWLAATEARLGRRSEAQRHMRDFIDRVAKEARSVPESAREWLEYLHRVQVYKRPEDAVNLREAVAEAGLSV